MLAAPSPTVKAILAGLDTTRAWPALTVKDLTRWAAAASNVPPALLTVTPLLVAIDPLTLSVPPLTVVGPV